MLKRLWTYFSIVFGGIIIAGGFNLFLIPHHLLSGGVSGVALIIGYFTPLNISVMYFVLNIPILITGWFKLGKRFVGLSVLSVIVTTLFLELIPVTPVATDMPLSSVFGGVLVGFGTGLSFRVGGSTGALILSAPSLRNIGTSRRKCTRDAERHRHYGGCLFGKRLEPGPCLHGLHLYCRKNGRYAPRQSYQGYRLYRNEPDGSPAGEGARGITKIKTEGPSVIKKGYAYDRHDAI